MKKEVFSVFLVVLLLLMPFSNAQLNLIEIKDVNVNDNTIQILIQNNFNQDFSKIIFIINNQYTIIQDKELKALETKFFVVNYQGGIKLENLQVIINDNTASYIFTGNEDNFVINQEITSQTSTQESNSPISYIYSIQRVAKIQDNNIIYFQSDNIDSTSIETDSTGAINFKANYLPFGKELSFGSIGKEKYGFSSKEYDAESSLNYFNARYYNPSNGKFISNDPIFKPTEGGYQYVRNNPLTVTDPSGNEIKIVDGDKNSGKIFWEILHNKNFGKFDILEKSWDIFTITFSDEPHCIVMTDCGGGITYSNGVIKPIEDVKLMVSLVNKNSVIISKDSEIDKKAAALYALNLLLLKYYKFDEQIEKKLKITLGDHAIYRYPQLSDYVTKFGGYTSLHLRAMIETKYDLSSTYKTDEEKRTAEALKSLGFYPYKTGFGHSFAGPVANVYYMPWQYVVGTSFKFLSDYVSWSDFITVFDENTGIQQDGNKRPDYRPSEKK